MSLSSLLEGKSHYLMVFITPNIASEKIHEPRIAVIIPQVSNVKNILHCILT